MKCLQKDKRVQHVQLVPALPSELNAPLSLSPNVWAGKKAFSPVNFKPLLIDTVEHFCGYLIRGVFVAIDAPTKIHVLIPVMSEDECDRDGRRAAGRKLTPKERPSIMLFAVDILFQVIG